MHHYRERNPHHPPQPIPEINQPHDRNSWYYPLIPQLPLPSAGEGEDQRRRSPLVPAETLLLESSWRVIVDKLG